MRGEPISSEVQNLLLFMENHAYADVKRAFKLLAAQKASLKVEEKAAIGAALSAAGWLQWDQDWDLPDNFEYRFFRNGIYVREIPGTKAAGIRLTAAEIKDKIASRGPELVKLKSEFEAALKRVPETAARMVASGAAAPGTGRASGKTDLSMKPTDKRCPLCGEAMAWEPICPGCVLGRQGFSGRYVCMDDFDHTFYVTKPGVELANS